MNKNELIQKIIPPPTREDREDFDSKKAIDSLTLSQKYIVEDELILLLEKESILDYFKIVALIYLKSKKSIPTLINLINKFNNENSYIILLASAVFAIDDSYEDMKSKALNAFNKLSNPYEIGTAFYYLSNFNDSNIDKVIESYIFNENYHISYHAKTALSRKMNNW